MNKCQHEYEIEYIIYEFVICCKKCQHSKILPREDVKKIINKYLTDEVN